MQSRLGRRTFGPAMVLGPVVALLLLVGVVLAVTRSGAETDVVVDDAGDPTSVTNGDDPSGADDDPDRPDGVESLAEGTIDDDAAVDDAPPAPAQSAGTEPGAQATPSATTPPRPGTPVIPEGGLAIAVGDCFTGTANTARDVTPIPCDGPHGSEIYAVLLSPGGPSAPYPGQEALLDQVAPICREDAFTDYVGVPWNESRYFTAPLVPSDITWAEGDRVVACFLYDLRGEQTESVQDAAG